MFVVAIALLQGPGSLLVFLGADLSGSLQVGDFLLFNADLDTLFNRLRVDLQYASEPNRKQGDRATDPHSR